MSTAVEMRMKEQEDTNKMLDQLHASVMNTKVVAGQIGNELGEQDKMLGRLDRGMDQANDEASRQTRGIVKLLQDSKHRGFYFAVAVLLVIIMILLAL